MKPWMWGVLALVAGLVLVVVLAATLGGDPIAAQTPPAAPASPVAEPAAPDAVEQVPPATPPSVTEVAATDTDPPGAGVPGIDPDAPSPMDEIPEDLTREEFDRVLDAVVEQCGLDDWSELERRCEGHGFLLRCLISE